MGRVAVKAMGGSGFAATWGFASFAGKLELSEIMRKSTNLLKAWRGW